jgi:GAF domain-containing protein
MPPDGDDDRHLAATFADVAREMFAASDVNEALHCIVTLAVATLEHCDSAGITMVRRGVVSAPASSNTFARRLDELQRELGQGPCVDVLESGSTAVVIDDLASDLRFPDFVRRARAMTSLASVMALRLDTQESGVLGALNMYSDRADAFDEVDLATASVFATHASLALAHVEMREDLEAKADSRDLIGRAKGILMAHEGITDTEAFDLLRRSSQRLNVKLTEIADAVNYTGDLPPDPGSA